MEAALKADFREMLTRLLGAADAEALCRALDTSPETALRLNPAKLSAPPSQLNIAEAVPWCPEGFRLTERPQFALMPLWHAGAFYVQESSSMVLSAIAAELAASAPGLRWLDLCAAPGGKTTAAIAALPSDALVVANEFDPRRASVLVENVTKWGSPSTVVTRGDTAWVRKMPERFHVVVVDAPCSGEGMMRKESMARQQWSPQLVASCAALQREILGNAWETLMPGGTLVYSTCTFNRSENEDNVRWLMETYGAESVPMPAAVASCGALPSLDRDIHALRFMPHVTNGEGLFIAILSKPGELDSSTGKREERRKQKRTSASDATKKALAAKAAEWLAKPENFTLRTDASGEITAIPAVHKEFVDEIAKRCPSVISCGLKISSVKGRDLIPAPELAFSTALSPEAFPTVALNTEEALDYLRRGTTGAAEALQRMDNPPRGYMLVTSDGVTLGFIKNLGNRINNLYPAAWRLRMN